MTDDSKIIISIEQTCEFCPSQWEFKTKDNRTGYVRYRWGVLKMQLSKINGDLNDALNSKSLLYCTLGEHYDGKLSQEKMLEALKLLGFEPIALYEAPEK